MGRTAKKSDLVKSDLKKFSIGLTEAKRLKITKEDLKGITEIIPDEKYSVRATTGNRKAEIFKGDLLGAIKRKNELNKNSKEKDKNVTTDITFMEAVSLYINYLFEREDRGDLDINTVFDHVKKINADMRLLKKYTKITVNYISSLFYLL